MEAACNKKNGLAGPNLVNQKWSGQATETGLKGCQTEFY